jgi:hypothetical protein
MYIQKIGDVKIGAAKICRARSSFLGSDEV